MLKYKQKIIKNQDKIVLFIGIILISVISFGLGRLSSNLTGSDEPVQIIETNILKAKAGDTDTGDAFKQNFVGSKNSDKYHLPDCQWAKRIKKENQIWFSSRQEAENKGYSPGSCITSK